MRGGEEALVGEPIVGLEPTTCSLRMSRYYQLSYIGADPPAVAEIIKAALRRQLRKAPRAFFSAPDAQPWR